MSLVSCKQVATNRSELIVEVKGELFTKAVDAAYRKNAKKIALPGFRKGKAPRAMIERVYGKGVFYDDAMNDLYPQAYTEAAKEAGITPVDSADVEVLDVNDEGFSFKATVTTKPVTKLGKYKGVEAVKKVREVTEEEIDAQISALRERNARVADVEGRPAKDGDITDINFEGFVDGVAFEGGKGENYPLTLGSNTFIPGFEEQIVGHSVGEEFDVNVTFPEEYGEASLAGKPAVFKVSINSIKEKQMPELDDEFAKDVSEFDTLEAYKADLRKKQAEQYEQQAAVEFENGLMDAVIDDMTVEVPDCMIEARVNDLLNDFAGRLAQQGLKLEDFIKYSGQDMEAFRGSFRPQAERQVKARLAMEAIAAAEKIEVSDEDIDAEYAKLAENYQVEVDRVRAVFPKEELLEDVLCRKALELIVAAGKAVEEKPEKKTEKKADAAADQEEAPKPKRTRKPKAQAEEGETAAAAQAEAEAPKPKRTRKPKAAAEGEAK